MKKFSMFLTNYEVKQKNQIIFESFSCGIEMYYIMLIFHLILIALNILKLTHFREIVLTVRVL